MEMENSRLIMCVIPVVTGTERALMLHLVLETVLMEGVFAEEVNGRQAESSTTETTLHHLEYLSTGEREGGREGERGRERGREGGRERERGRTEGGREGGS